MLGLDLRGSEFSYESRFHTKGVHQTTSEMGLSSPKNYCVFIKVYFPIEISIVVIAQTGVIVVVEVEV